jgi:hypothetical protein
MVTVLNRSSGWSAALQEITDATLERAPISKITLGSMAASLSEATHLGIEHGAPLFIANVAGTLVEEGVRELGAGGSVDLLARKAGLLAASAAATA